MVETMQRINPLKKTKKYPYNRLCPRCECRFIATSRLTRICPNCKKRSF